MPSLFTPPLLVVVVLMPFCPIIPLGLRLSLMSGAAFVLLIFLSTLARNAYVKGIAYSISKNSFPIFLLHHFIIIEGLKKLIGTHQGKLEILCSFILVCLLIGAITYLILKMEYGIRKWNTQLRRDCTG